MPYTEAKQNSVLIVSGSERSRATLAEVFSSSRYAPVTTRGSAAEVRRQVLDAPHALVFINTPLPDETGVQLALDLSSSRNCCVALIVPGDTYDQVNEQVEDAGVLTLARPCTAQQLRQAAAMMVLRVMLIGSSPHRGPVRLRLMTGAYPDR